jgi:hypothetical protein
VKLFRTPSEWSFSSRFLAFLREHDVPSILYLWQLDLLLVGRLPTVKSHPLVASLTAASLLGVCSPSAYDSVFLSLMPRPACADQDALSFPLH